MSTLDSTSTTYTLSESVIPDPKMIELKNTLGDSIKLKVKYYD